MSVCSSAQKAADGDGTGPAVKVAQISTASPAIDMCGRCDCPLGAFPTQREEFIMEWFRKAAGIVLEATE